MAKNRYILHERDFEYMDVRFIQSYDYRYWKYKIYLLEHGINNADEITNPDIHDVFEEESGDATGLRLSIKSEYVSMFYHMSEALFTVCKVLLEEGVAWIDMMETYPKDLKEFVEHTFVESNITDDELVNLFFPFIFTSNISWEDTSGEFERKAIDSIDFAREYLRRIGEKFTEDKIYNHYKHGLRLSMYDGTVEVDYPEIFEGTDIETNSDGDLQGDSYYYFEPKEDDRNYEGNYDNHRMSEIITTIDYERHKQLCLTNYILIKQIFKMHQLILSIEPEDRLRISTESIDREISVPTFEDEDIDEIFYWDETGYKFDVYRANENDDPESDESDYHFYIP